MFPSLLKSGVASELRHHKLFKGIVELTILVYSYQASIIYISQLFYKYLCGLPSWLLVWYNRHSCVFSLFFLQGVPGFLYNFCQTSSGP